MLFLLNTAAFVRAFMSILKDATVIFMVNVCMPACPASLRLFLWICFLLLLWRALFLGSCVGVKVFTIA